MSEKLPFAKTFEDLQVFQRAYKLSIQIHKVTMTFPSNEQFGGGMGDQMRRASKSVCANLAEGFGKNASKADMKRFTLIALGRVKK